MCWLAQVRISLPELRRQGAGELDQGNVAQVGNLEFWDAALAHAKEITRAAQAQIFIGETEAVVGPLEDLQAFLSLDTGIRAENVAVGLMLAAPDTPTKLVELRETKAICILDDHHCSVGDVDADLNHRGGNQNVQFVVAETAHHLVFINRLHSTM